mmetsp:Transcript_23665/g.52106  ORF Transcript_23665/g.52106 Transcript_23665/m.52106 type:complete len:100 (-) Transcript_23665:802-1101(-)
MTKDDPPPKEAAPAKDTGKEEAAAAPEPAGQSNVFLKYILVGVVAMLAYRGVEEMTKQSTAVATVDGKAPALVDGPRVAEGEPPIVLDDHQVLIQHCVS